jgi:hypothetical protein
MDYETRSVRLRKDYRPQDVNLSFTQFPREADTYETFTGTVSDATGKIQLQAGEQAEVQKLRFAPRTVAARLARQYGLAFFPLYRQLEQLAAGTDFTAGEIALLGGQIEAALGDRFEEEIRRERVRLALVKKDGFPIDEQGNHYAEIRYAPDREHLICDHRGEALGFHYTPYNFDSTDEKDFFYELLAAVGETPESIEDIYYTGAISSPEKTDFWFWYRGVEDRWHRYTPDFLFRRKDGRMLIVEIKPKGNTEENLVTQQKEKKLREIVSLNPHTVQFEIVEGFSRLIQTPQVMRVRKFAA